MRLAYWSALLPSVASLVTHDTSALEARYSCSTPGKLVTDIREASNPGNPYFVVLAQATAEFMTQFIQCFKDRSLKDRNQECRDAETRISSIGLTTEDDDIEDYLVPFHGFWLGFIMRVWTEHMIDADDPREWGDIRKYFGAPEGFRVSTMPKLPYVWDDRAQDDQFVKARAALIPVVKNKIILDMWVEALSKTCGGTNAETCKFFSVLNTLGTWQHQVGKHFATSVQGDCFVELNKKNVPAYGGRWA